MADKKDLKKIVSDVFKALTPKPGDDSYNCARALLIVFNDFVEKDINSFKFNYKDLYELITGKDAGRICAPLELIEQYKAEQDPQTKRTLNAKINGIEQTRKHNDHQARAFMENVNDALTLTAFHRDYNRDLILTEVEGEEWIAIDLKMLKTVEISF